MNQVHRTYLYTFTFNDGRKLDFTVSLDSKSLFTTTCPSDPPKWAELEHHQCGPCTLSKSQSLYCPGALCVVELVVAFGNTKSYTPCTVSCESQDRIVTKETTVQEGLASLLSLLIPISGCPVMSFFKPLSRFHLPFSTVEESAFRVTGSYFLKKYFTSKSTAEEQYCISDIGEHYGLANHVNRGILARIKDLNSLDADKNSLVTLSCLAQILEMEIAANLESIQHIFC